MVTATRSRPRRSGRGSWSRSLTVQRAFRQAGSEVRLVHPFATKQFRQPADPGNKTDDTDLAPIHRAAVNGLGLIEPAPPPYCPRCGGCRFVPIELPREEGAAAPGSDTS